MADKKKKWRDLTPGQQRTVIVAGLIELVVTAFAIRDLVRRPKDQVVGPKALWFASFAVQPFGPLGYLLKGRRITDSHADTGPAVDAGA